jgi:hypothetical protein
MLHSLCITWFESRPIFMLCDYDIIGQSINGSITGLTVNITSFLEYMLPN